VIVDVERARSKKPEVAAKRLARKLKEHLAARHGVFTDIFLSLGEILLLYMYVVPSSALLADIIK
jgi:hypothetical protein